MTPKQKMQYKKEQEILRQQEMMKEGARNAIGNYAFAKERKLQDNFEKIMGDTGKDVIFGQPIDVKLNDSHKAKTQQYNDEIDFERDLLE